MRSPQFLLAVSLAVVFAVLYSFGSVFSGPRGNLTDDVIIIFGLVAALPSLLVALIAAIAVVRRARAPLPHTTRTFGCLGGLLAGGVVWAFWLFLVMAVGSA